jgi:hypothetical protein
MMTHLTMIHLMMTHLMMMSDSNAAQPKTVKGRGLQASRGKDFDF